MNRSINKRTAMLDAGIAELAEQGLAGASMESIAGRAEVSKRTLYKHFPSKDAVFEAVLLLLIEGSSHSASCITTGSATSASNCAGSPNRKCS